MNFLTSFLVGMVYGAISSLILILYFQTIYNSILGAAIVVLPPVVVVLAIGAYKKHKFNKFIRDYYKGGKSV